MCPFSKLLEMMIYREVSVAGIWIDSNLEVMYALATRITFICPMRFNAFPMDIQVENIHFQLPSFPQALTPTLHFLRFASSKLEASTTR